jgi:hypothetical protein
MRNMSFALTTTAVRHRQKTVTRRLGWKNLQPGTLIQPVVKGMGLGKGGKVEKIGGPIRVVSVRREPLNVMCDAPFGDLSECAGEGFPQMMPENFVGMFMDHNRCAPDTEVTRIEFEYLDVDGGHLKPSPIGTTE